MLVKELEWTSEKRCDGEDTLFLCKTDLGRFTVLDRLTGYGYAVRDTETGFKDTAGKFWLASGMFDIRQFPQLTIQEAIDMVKEQANTCVGA